MPSSTERVTYRAWLLQQPARVAAWLDDILTPADVVAQYPSAFRCEKTLANWRSAQRGPTYIALGGRILYRRLDLIAYLDTRTVRTKEGRAVELLK